MKIILTEKQIGILGLYEQTPDEKLEKTLSSFTYQDKPHSCVQHEPMDIGGEKIFPKIYPKKVIYTKDIVNGDDKRRDVITFFKENKAGNKNVVTIQIGVSAKDKRIQQIEFVGSFMCGKGTNTTFKVNRRIEDKITDKGYYQADAKGKVKDWVRQTTPFTPIPFSGTLPTGTYNSLKELATDINKIKVDFNNLNTIT